MKRRGFFAAAAGAVLAWCGFPRRQTTAEETTEIFGEFHKSLLPENAVVRTPTYRVPATKKDDELFVAVMGGVMLAFDCPRPDLIRPKSTVPSAPRDPRYWIEYFGLQPPTGEFQRAKEAAIAFEVSVGTEEELVEEFRQKLRRACSYTRDARRKTLKKDDYERIQAALLRYHPPIANSGFPVRRHIDPKWQAYDDVSVLRGMKCTEVAVDEVQEEKT